MDLHYLRIFYEVAKEGSFTKAAHKLFINQSAVSIQVKKFEEILDTKLFDRSSKKIKLTYSGKVLYKMAEEIFQKVKRAEKEIARIVESKKAKVVIGATHIIGEPLLPKLMKNFSAIHSEIEYDIHLREKEYILKMLREGEIDIAVIDETHITDQNLKVIRLTDYPFVFVSNMEYEDVREVTERPLIIRDNIPKQTHAIELMEEKYNMSFEKKIGVKGSLQAIKDMVSEGVGNVFLPYYAAYKEVESGEFKVIDKIPNVSDAYQVVITLDKENLLEIQKFISYVKDFKII